MGRTCLHDKCSLRVALPPAFGKCENTYTLWHRAIQLPAYRVCLIDVCIDFTDFGAFLKSRAEFTLIFPKLIQNVQAVDKVAVSVQVFLFLFISWVRFSCDWFVSSFQSNSRAF